MLLNYDKWVEFIEWIAKKEKWPYFDIADNESFYNDERFWFKIKYEFNKNEWWIAIYFTDRDFYIQEKQFKLETINNLYRDFMFEMITRSK